MKWFCTAPFCTALPANALCAHGARTVLYVCRVVPLHSLKLISELQYQLVKASPDSSQQRNPLLIRVEVRAGHGAGKPTAKIIAETSDLLSFAAECVGAKWAAAG